METNNIEEIAFYQPVAGYIPEVESLMLSQADGCYPDLGIALKHLVGSGGKRIRPTVTLLTGRMLGGDRNKLITLAAAIEMLHTATLVHDDLIDGALLRRGIATLNSKWSPAATVLTGDYIFSRAAKLAADTGSILVMQLFAETLTIIVNGEIEQLFTSNGMVAMRGYEKRIYAKTASMFELATAAAAILSPVDDRVIEQMKRYGYSIGIAFQIVDDILDFIGSQSAVGKPVGGDLKQGLITSPAIYYYNEHPDDPIFNKIIQGKSISNEEIQKLVDLITASDAIDKSLNDARRYVQKGIEYLSDFPDNEEKRALKELANYIVDRDL